MLTTIPPTISNSEHVGEKCGIINIIGAALVQSNILNEYSSNVKHKEGVTIRGRDTYV